MMAGGDERGAGVRPPLASKELARSSSAFHTFAFRFSLVSLQRRNSAGPEVALASDHPGGYEKWRPPATPSK